MIEKVKSESVYSHILKRQLVFKNMLLFLSIFIGFFFFFTACSDNYNASEAKALVEEKCVKCHKLPTPDVRTDEQWDKILARKNDIMAKRNVPTLSRREKRMILRYMKENN